MPPQEENDRLLKAHLHWRIFSSSSTLASECHVLVPRAPRANASSANAFSALTAVHSSWCRPKKKKKKRKEQKKRPLGPEMTIVVISAILQRVFVALVNVLNAMSRQSCKRPAAYSFAANVMAKKKCLDRWGGRRVHG